MKNLIDYVIKMPESDDHNVGYKFPFNACEILQSENGFILDKIFESVEHIEVEEGSKRKLSNVSNEAYRDDHSMDDSQDSAEDEHILNHGQHEIPHSEREIESKNLNSAALLSHTQNDLEGNHRVIGNSELNLGSNLSQNFNEMAHSSVRPLTAENSDENNNIQHSEKENERTDDEILNDIGKKIQNLEIKVGIEQIVVHDHDILMENNEEDEAIVESEVKNENIKVNNEDTQNKVEKEENDLYIEAQPQSNDEEIKHEILIDEAVKEEEDNQHEILIEESNNYQDETKNDNFSYNEVRDETENREAKNNPIKQESTSEIEYQIDKRHEEKVADSSYSTNLNNEGMSDSVEETENKEISLKEEEEKDPSTKVRHKAIPRHKKHHSKKHEFFAEEEDIFNISNDNIQNDSHLETPVKEVKFEIIINLLGKNQI
jgi:hypothetical protein